ncbi:hypothetical protein PQR72_27665 [Paraburkholderia madseniana]|uniref:hypothetical protein n=1 Tax=Paraburkholderia madseniana TaxID=2599607 RepID=UPI0015C56639|nr:hypothetical protein [Paraburkholderia madseniana]NPT68075.1 hypothetical protein [Paraburkholderia madseniana]
MTNKMTIDLGSVIPLSAIKVIIDYQTVPGAKALLHRFEGDQNPVVLKGPSGTVEVNVSQSRKLYLERLDAADWAITPTSFEI